MCHFLAGIFAAAAEALRSLGSFLEEQVGQLGNVSLLFSAWDVFPFFLQSTTKNLSTSHKRVISV